MKYLLEMCLIAISLTASTTQPAAAQSTSDNAIPHLRKGISVDLPRTTSAVSIPEGDNLDVLIVTIKTDCTIFLGTNPIGTTEMTKKLKESLSSQAGKDVYIKADARAPYASVVKILDSLHAAGIERVTLLTAQPEAQAPETVTPPKGLEMLMVTSRK